MKAIPEEAIGKVLAAVDRDEVIALTRQLVRINSVWDPAAGTGEQEAADRVARWAAEQGFGVQVDEVSPGRPNVILRCGAAAGGGPAMFEGHTDVVTPGRRSAWRHDPFGAEIVGGRMYGRGTNDTKGNLAAMLVAMAAVQRSGLELAGGLLGGVLCDEEGGMSGVLDFIDRGHADGVSAAVICEPQDGLLCTSQKGAIRASYRITGRMSHGAMPLKGLNSAPALARLIDGLHRLERESVAAVGRHPDLGWPSFTPTVIQAPSEGPAQLNVMPGEAEVLVDVRTVPAQLHPAIRRAMDALADEVALQVQAHYAEYDGDLEVERDRGIRLEVEYLTDRPCTKTDAQDPVVKAADWATRQIGGQEPVYGGVLGATDGTFLWARKQIPIVTMGAGTRHVAHQADEWVGLDQLAETARIYALTALHYLWGGGDGRPALGRRPSP